MKELASTLQLQEHSKEFMMAYGQNLGNIEEYYLQWISITFALNILKQIYITEV